MERNTFDDEETFKLMQMQEYIAKNERIEIDIVDDQKIAVLHREESGCRPNECLFPNCQCTDAPTRVGTPGDINHQINFVRGMREVLQANKDAQVVMDAQHVAMLLAVEETLLAARLIQKALRA